MLYLIIVQAGVVSIHVKQPAAEGGERDAGAGEMRGGWSSGAGDGDGEEEFGDEVMYLSLSLSLCVCLSLSLSHSLSLSFSLYYMGIW